MAEKKRTVVFKVPGGSLSIGSQRFDQSNITPAIYDELVRINPANADHFTVVEADADKSILEGEEKDAKPAAKPAKQP